MAGGVDIILASFVVRSLSVPNDGGWWGGDIRCPPTTAGEGRQAVVARPRRYGDCVPPALCLGCGL